MELKEELGLKVGFRNRAHEGLLNVYFTGQMISKKARDFFSKYGITEVQFNLLGLLYFQAKREEGLTQAELSRMMLVHRSNVTGLIDRMEKNGLVIRSEVEGDRRFNSIHLTEKGRRIYEDVEERYMSKVKSIMGVLDSEELDDLIGDLGKIRVGLNEEPV